MFHRHGAEAARGAHNSEVTRSKRVAGIFIIASSVQDTSQRVRLSDQKQSGKWTHRIYVNDCNVGVGSTTCSRAYIVRHN